MMLAKLLDFDWLAIAGWGGAGLLAAAAVWAFVALPTARWAWKALGLGAAVLVTLMLFRTALSNAEQHGYDRAAQEFEAAAQAQAEAWQAQVRQADERAAKAINRIDKAERSSRERIKQHYAQSPSSCGISPPGIGLLYEADTERAACAATGRCYALRKAPAAAEGNGAE